MKDFKVSNSFVRFFFSYFGVVVRDEKCNLSIYLIFLDDRFHLKEDIASITGKELDKN